MKRTSAIAGRRAIWNECLQAEYPWERAKGIMFWKQVTAPYVISFPQEDKALNTIHSFFCPPFDAVFIDAAGVVVDLVPNITAGRFVTPKEDCVAVIECPPGGAQAKRITIGSRITLVEKP